MINLYPLISIDIHCFPKKIHHFARILPICLYKKPIYPLVISQSYGKSPFLIGNSSFLWFISGPFFTILSNRKEDCSKALLAQRLTFVFCDRNRGISKQLLSSWWVTAENFISGFTQSKNYGMILPDYPYIYIIRRLKSLVVFFMICHESQVGIS